jgi:hypothetical protein
MKTAQLSPGRLLAISLALFSMAACVPRNQSSEASDAQQKSVDFATLERAAAQTVECLRDAGLTPKPAVYDGNAFTFMFTVTEASKTADARTQACMNEHFEPVNERWQEVNLPTINRANAELKSALAACIQARGASLATEGDIDSEAVHEECLIELLEKRSDPSRVR